VLALAIGVMIGGAIQLAIQLPALFRAGFRWRREWSHAGASDVMRLLGPRIMGSAAYQAGVLIDTALASLSAVVGQGAVAALYFANRLVQLPLAVFGTAAAQASLPTLSEQAAHDDLAAFRRTLVSVLRMVGFVMFPAAAGLIALAGPIVTGLFERGAFDPDSSRMTAQALACYALGLAAFAVTKVVTGAFYALHDTRTPVRLAMQSVALNVMLSLLLMWPLKVNGLALAAALSNSVTAFRLVRHLERRLDQPILEPAASSWRAMAAAAGVMGAGCWAMWQAGLARLPAWIGLPLAVLAGMALYAGACRIAGVPELSTVLRWLNKIPLLQNFEDE
jgi:putative peptidoglycan lipid II flippase